MYDQHQQQTPPDPYGGQVNIDQPIRPSRPMGRALRIVGAAMAVIIAFGAGVAVGRIDTTNASPAASQTSTTPRPKPTEQPAAVEQEPEPEPTLTYATPQKDDFELTVKVLSKECFGSAGCSLTFRIELGYGGPEIDPNKTYELTYEVRGGEDTQINTLTIDGDQYQTDQEEYITTPKSSAKLTAVVTDVSEL